MIFFNKSPSSGNYIHHLREGIYFYLKSFIVSVQITPSICFLGYFLMKDDMKNIFDIDVIKHEKNNSKYNKIITDKNYEILKTY